MASARPCCQRVNVTAEDRYRVRKLVERLGTIKAAREALGVGEPVMGCLLDGWRVNSARLVEIRQRLDELEQVA